MTKLLTRTKLELCIQIALTVIARCGFGLRMPWADGAAADGDMTFGEALTIVSGSAITRLVLPRWVYKLPIGRQRSFHVPDIPRS
jgi:hypothetical protein